MRGFAIALAWPQARCKPAGSWYDGVMKAVGLCPGGKYCVGHAALVLVDGRGRCFYYDFGRYLTPEGHARVRSALKDRRLELSTVIRSEGGRIRNLHELLDELQSMADCHGEGVLHAGYVPIDYTAAMRELKKLHDEPFIRYGPFIRNGSNCSRFVRSVLLAGRPPLRNRLALSLLLTPLPLHNVRVLRGCMYRPPAFGQRPSRFIPHSAHRLDGVGAGSWFALDHCDNLLQVQRYDDHGGLESSMAHPLPRRIDLDRARVTYPSDCSQITLHVDGEAVHVRRCCLL